MAPNFIECGREQAFLMPPSLRDWVPGEHLVWTMLEAVEEMELSDFYADYRDDGHGRPAYDPKMMVALCSTPTRRATAPRAGSSANAKRMSPTG
jgi:transposase